MTHVPGPMLHRPRLKRPSRRGKSLKNERHLVGSDNLLNKEAGCALMDASDRCLIKAASHRISEPLARAARWNWLRKPFAICLIQEHVHQLVVFDKLISISQLAVLVEATATNEFPAGKPPT